MSDISPHHNATTFPSPPRDLFKAFERAYSGLPPDVVVRAPGRVNLLGGHIDMHGGPVINIAADRGIWLAAAFGPKGMSEIHAVDLGQAITLSHKTANLDRKLDIIGQPLPRWALYPAGVAWAVLRRGFKLNGIYAAFGGDLPMRAGLSSSAAVEEAFIIAWQALSGWRQDNAELARLGHEVERDYMDIGSGIQDQFTCLHARQKQALWLDCRSLEFRYIPWPKTARIVICDTNTRRELAGSSYTQRATDAHAAARALRLLGQGIDGLRDMTLDQLESFTAILTESQFRRARHVVTEIERVGRGRTALEQGDLAAFGSLMNESYRSARDDYGSSSPALDAMWEAATSQPGCYGARYSGGGEAGVVVALVAAEAVESFIHGAAEQYADRTGTQGTLFTVEPAAGAGVWG